MKCIFQSIKLIGCLTCGLVVSTVHAELALDDQAAIFTAAGFKKAAGGQYSRCEEEMPTASYQPGQIELVDLNNDGQSEAWITESSIYCYGNTAEFFVLVTNSAGGWHKLIEAVGIPQVQEAKHEGWPDIEVGGPGFGKFPVYRWDGKSYLLSK